MSKIKVDTNLKPLFIEPCDMYVAIIDFLGKYNKNSHSIDITCLKSEMSQPHLAQGTYRLWLTTLRETLSKFGFLEEDINAEQRILPEYIKIDPYHAYQAVINFLNKYNENLQSVDIRNLVTKMQDSEHFLAAWKDWESLFLKYAQHT